jgi:hypothetical protein
MTVNEEPENINLEVLLLEFEKMIINQQDIPVEFVAIVEEHFWELLM